MAAQTFRGKINKYAHLGGHVAAAGVDEVDGNRRWLVLGEDDAQAPRLDVVGDLILKAPA